MRKEYIHQSPARSAYCGPATLAMAFEAHDLQLSQELLAIWAGFTPEWGTEYDGMFRVAQQFFDPEIVVGASLEALARVAPVKPVVVNWMTGSNHHEDGHYSLLDSVFQLEVVLMDPDIGRRVMPRPEFEDKWWDLAKSGRVERWAMILHPKDR
jgi:predicted double-glycine peptidase